MACLDTSFLIDLLRGREEVKSLKDELDRIELRITIAAPSVMELWEGALLMSSSREQEKIQELLQSIEILPLDEKSAKEAAEIRVSLQTKGIMIETVDILIAGIARLHGEKVVTRDEHFTRISGLRVLKY